MRRQGTAVNAYGIPREAPITQTPITQKSAVLETFLSYPQDEAVLAGNTTTSLEMRATVLTPYSICVLWFAACRPLETCVSFHWSVCVVSP